MNDKKPIPKDLVVPAKASIVGRHDSVPDSTPRVSIVGHGVPDLRICLRGNDEVFVIHIFKPL